MQDLSEEALYWGCKRTDRNRRPGSRFESADAALQRWGQPHEERYPYDPTRDDTQPLRAIADAGGPGWFRHRLRQTPITEEALKEELNQHRLVAIGLLLTRAFHASRDGNIPLPTPGEAFLGGHAVTLVGYDDDRGSFIFRNSWGNRWGDRGYGYLPYGYLGHIKDAWTVDSR
jgi:hypothetical protein